MKRAELDWTRPAKTVIGTAEPLRDDHNDSHAFLYIPDLSSQTGWSGHKVPQREEHKERREVGFRR